MPTIKMLWPLFQLNFKFGIYRAYWNHYRVLLELNLYYFCWLLVQDNVIHWQILLDGQGRKQQLTKVKKWQPCLVLINGKKNRHYQCINMNHAYLLHMLFNEIKESRILCTILHILRDTSYLNLRNR